MNTKNRPYKLSILPMAIATLVLTAAPSIRAAEFSEAELFFELNDTDGDLGLHASIDGEPYRMLEIAGPKSHLLTVLAEGRLARQGLTQLSFESAEPGFDELTPEEFFQRFPEGVYKIKGMAHGGGKQESEVELSHVLAAAPANVLISGVPAAENCDAASLPLVSEPVIIDWDPVTTSHPTIGKSGAIEIAKYQLFVEREGVNFAVDLPPTVTAFHIPPEIIALGNEFKFEIIARTTTGNNTAIENCFIVE